MEAMYREQDRYAEAVSKLLGDGGYIENEEEMKRFLRGW